MLYSVKELLHYEIGATDGSIGKISGFYFNPETWAIRYLIVDTSEWMPGKKVLIPLLQLGRPDAKHRMLPIGLSKGQIERSATIDKDAPLLLALHDMNAYYGWAAGEKEMLANREDRREGAYLFPEEGKLRGTQEVMGYFAQAEDGNVGFVEDFVVDDEGWAIRYVVIDAVEGERSRKVMACPAWTDEIGWRDKTVRVAATRETIRNSPEFDPASLTAKEYQQRLYDFCHVTFVQESERGKIGEAAELFA